MPKPTPEEVHNIALEAFKENVGDLLDNGDIPDNLNSALLKRTTAIMKGQNPDGPMESNIRKILGTLADKIDGSFAELLSAHFDYKVSVDRQLGKNTPLYNLSKTKSEKTEIDTTHQIGLESFHAVKIPGIKRNTLPPQTEDTLKTYTQFSEKNAATTGPVILIDRKETQDSIRNLVVEQLAESAPEGLIRSAVDRYFEAVNKKIGATLGLAGV